MKKEVFLVDDDPVVEQILSMFLSSKGYAMSYSENGRTFLETLKERVQSESLPNVVFLDFMLSDMTGGEVLTEVRAIVGDQHLPVVILSASTREEMLENHPDIHPDFYLEKPFSADEVFSVLKLALEE